jgi:hypothetical protein
VSGKRRDVLEELFKRHIQTVLIGGLAVKVHGTPRMTEDMDLAARLVDMDTIVDMMYDLGYRLPTSAVDLPDGSQKITWAEDSRIAKSYAEKNKLGACNFHMTVSPDSDDVVDQVDFIFENPVPFSRIMGQAKLISETPPIRVACVLHLIAMKERRVADGKAGPNDECDLRFLRELQTHAEKEAHDL